jgi:hypothetical protein
MTWWDHKTGSIWSQPWGAAIFGKLRGESQDLIPAEVTNWQSWHEAHPATTVVVEERDIDINLGKPTPQDNFVIGISLGEDAVGDESHFDRVARAPQGRVAVRFDVNRRRCLPDVHRERDLGGRAAVVGVAVLVGFVSILVAAPLAFSGDVQVAGIVMYMLSTMLLAVVFVSIAVSVSAFAESTFGAAVGTGSFFVLFQFAWRGVVELLRWVVNGFEHPGFMTELPDWAEVVIVLNPMTAYQRQRRGCSTA